MRRIFPSITTISSNWRDKIKEIKELGLEEISIFPTCLNLSERKELYDLLKEAKVKSIPFVHLRSDMELWELDYLIKNYGTELFNAHTTREYSLSPELMIKYKNIIYIENTYKPYDEEEIKKFAGICLDFSHLENDRDFRPEVYQHNVEIIEKYGCGCNHISSAKSHPILDEMIDRKEAGRHHLFDDLSEFNYLKKYHKKYFSSFIAMELENSIKDQLRAIDYVIRTVGGRFFY